MPNKLMRRAVALAALLAALPVQAQGAPAIAEAIDPGSVPMPNLAFTPTDDDVRNYDKYFYFHREGSDFATAYADLQECDGYGRDLSFYASSPGGGALEGALFDAIYGSAERRRQRRNTMRTCMSFKGYRTYGLSKALWEEFNFSEGLTQIAEERRQRLLQMQARVASGPTPTIGEITE